MAPAPTDTLAGAPAPQAARVHAGPISPTLSLNFSVAKVAAIFAVVLGHFGVPGIGSAFWIPVTFGLFLFAFSSGYFTESIYGPRVDRATFWRKKLERLGLRYWVILGFIVLVVTLKGRSVLHWHSLVHFSGLSGVLNWFAIPNHSPLGAGLWFFTLLLLFYLAYPTLARAARHPALALAMLGGGFVLAVVLQQRVNVGHMLWLTAYAFVAGVVCSARRLRLPPLAALLGAALLCVAMVLLNKLGVKDWNLALIAGTGLCIALWLVGGRVPDWPLTRLVAGLEKYLLEIFMIHGYLFVRPTGRWGLDLLLTLALVLVASMLVGRVADALSGLVFRKR